MAYAFVSTEKVKTLGALRRKMDHNFRIGNVKNADPDRIKEDEELIAMAPGEDYIDKFRNMVNDSRYYKERKVRKDAVKAIEVMMTFDQSKVHDGFDLKEWKEQNLQWLKHEFGEENVISAVLHMDETNPHIHAMVIPMVNERLNAKHFLGGKARLRELQTNYGHYMEKVGLQRGLLGSCATHTDIRKYYDALNKELAKELPEPKPKETVADYKKRVDEIYQTANLKYMRALLDKQREMDEFKTLKLSEKIEFQKEKNDFESEKDSWEREFGSSREIIKSQIKKLEALDNGMQHYPDRDYARQIFDGIQEMILFEENRQKKKGKFNDKEHAEEKGTK